MSEIQELIPGLPYDVALECLTRLEISTHVAATGVCHQWRQLLKSKEFSLLKKQNGLTRCYACLVQAKHDPTASKLMGQTEFGISVFDSVSRSWIGINSVPAYPDSFPLFCQVVGSEGKLILMGGWDPESYEPLTGVFMYDFLTHKWKQGKNMPSKRSFFAVGEFNGRVYVAGGHDPDKNGLDSALVYDILEDEWTELGQMSETRDECQGLMIGSEFWVVSGYDTENQGEFKASADVFDINSGKWSRVEDAWVAGRSPRSCVGAGKNKKLINWGELNSEVRIGTNVVELDDRILISGSVSEGGSRGFYLGKKQEDGEYGEFEKLLDLPFQFLGFVQTGCCVQV